MLFRLFTVWRTTEGAVSLTSWAYGVTFVNTNDGNEKAITRLRHIKHMLARLPHGNGEPVPPDAATPFFHKTLLFWWERMENDR